MEQQKKKIAILTGGGDAPGLNSVIYTIVKTAILKYDFEVIGYKFGYRGLYTNDYMELNLENTSGLLHVGGTILFSSNKDNLFDYTVEENGQKVKKDVSDVAVENLKKDGVDALIILGGDGTLTSARDFSRKGVKVVGVPKTIDNDLRATDATFGFNTAIDIVVENLGRIHTTARSHHRVFVVEVMGRTAGWIAIASGIAGSADVILIPEIPYTIENIVKKIKQRDEEGKVFTIIVVCEGAKEFGGEAVVNKVVEDSPEPIRLGGIGAKLAHQLEQVIDNHEVRSVSLGNIQRGGEPSAYDRLLSVRYGVAAVDLVADNNYGQMVCIKKGQISHHSLENVIGGTKNVDPDGEYVNAARSLGISFGDGVEY
ncbi:MAG: ATP-dependent 6-phosphofructokinase [Firmicutes bacterium]|nr:ATP-dependent 6-phosphofructokinase [Bacillota bacterium]